MEVFHPIELTLGLTLRADILEELEMMTTTLTKRAKSVCYAAWLSPILKTASSFMLQIIQLIFFIHPV